jgi:CubicO group peptidase (beta-lactamase class C family)
MNVEIHGVAEPGWGAVADVFAANFARAGDVGANVAVYLDGRPVVDLWGGIADPVTATPWSERSVGNIFSCTKGLLATLANQLIQEGLLDPDATVATYWPEFAANGKDGITVRLVLSHQAGLAAIAGVFTLDEALSWTPIVDALAGQATNWVPGTRHGYHMRSFGWLVGELVRRVTGLAPGTAFRARIAEPLGLSTWIGMPASEQSRCARLLPAEPSEDDPALTVEPGSLQDVVPTGPSGLFHYDDMWNRPQLRGAQIPSSGGISDARSLARTYAACIGTVDGVRLLEPATVSAASAVQAEGTDAVLGRPTSFGLGYMVPPSLLPACGPASFGHPGAGGSMAFGDPEARLAFAYSGNQLRMDPGDSRAADLAAAAYRALG